jgi:hypothetical protein
MKCGFLFVWLLCAITASAQDVLVLGPLTKKQKPQNARLHFDDSGRAISIVTLKKGRQMHVTDAQRTQSKTFNYLYALGEGATLEPNLLLLPPNAETLLGSSMLVWEQVAQGYYHEYLVDIETGNLVIMRTNLENGLVETTELLAIPENDYPIHLKHTADGLLYITLSPKTNVFNLHRLHRDGSKKVDQITIDLSGLFDQGKLDRKKDANLDKIYAELKLLKIAGLKAAGVTDSLIPGSYHDFENASGILKKYHLGDTLALFRPCNNGDALLNINLIPANNTYTMEVINSPAHTMALLQKIAPDVPYESAAEFDKKARPVCLAYSQRYFALIRVHKPHCYIQYFDRANGQLHHMEYFTPEKEDALPASQIKPAPWFVDTTQDNAITSRKFLTVLVASLGEVGFNLIDVSPDSVQALLMVKDERIKLSDVAGAIVESAAALVPVGSLVSAFAVGAAGSLVGDLSTAAFSMAENKEVYCLSRKLDANTLMPPSGFAVAPLPALQKVYNEAIALQSHLSKGISVVSMSTHNQQNFLAYFDEASNQYLLKKL